MSSRYCMRCRRCERARFSTAVRLTLPPITGEVDSTPVTFWICNSCVESSAKEWTP